MSLRVANCKELLLNINVYIDRKLVTSNVKTLSLLALFLIGGVSWTLGRHYTFAYVLALFCWGIATYALADRWMAYSDRKVKKSKR
jgi:hypothetical protein